MDIWTPLAVATGAVIKPLMDKLCSAEWWEKHYNRTSWKKFVSLLLRRQ